MSVYKAGKYGQIAKILLGLIGLATVPARAQTYTVLHNFTGYPTDASEPYNYLTVSGSMIYGPTTNGGTRGGGAIISINPSNNSYNLVYSQQGNGDELFPYGGFAPSGSLLYGTSKAGGANGDGTIYSFNPASNAEHVVYSFTGSSTANGSLVGEGSLFYGTALGGDGTIYSFNPANNNVATVYTFTGGTSDGASPTGDGPLVASGALLYGETNSGGANGDGVIYSFNTLNNSTNILHSFSGSSGDGYPTNQGLIGSGTVLYGTTSGGGANGAGVIFSYDTSDNQFNMLASLPAGFDPEGSLVQSGSILYGMSEQGGANDYGSIYSFDTSDDSLTILHSFDLTDGESPFDDGMVLVNNTLYGMTSNGGTDNFGDGVVFALTVPEPATAGLLGLSVLFVLQRRRRKLFSE
jgi:uncharacterized repeat protein (TIGR03803 family)